MMVLIYQAAFAAGYLLARREQPTTVRRQARERAAAWEEFRFKWTLVPITSLSIVISLGTALSVSGLASPVELIGNLYESILSPGAAYASTASENIGSGSIWTQLATLASPVVLAVDVIGLVFWRYVSVLTRGLLVTDLFLQASLSALRGQNFGLFRVAAVVAAVLIINRQIEGRRRLNARSRRRLWLLSLVAITSFVLTTTDRFRDTQPSTVGALRVDYETPVVAILPGAVKLPFVLICSYVSQGYYGFSRVMGHGLQSTWGVGTSVFLMEYTDSFSTDPIWHRTLQYRIRHEWDDTANWHTAYTWIANDVGVVGVIPVMVFLGWIVCRVFTRVEHLSLVACVLLPMVLLGIAFLPANTVVMSNPLTCVPILVWGSVFLASEMRRLVRRRAADSSGRTVAEA